jgi:hypothetical protein
MRARSPVTNTQTARFIALDACNVACYYGSDLQSSPDGRPAFAAFGELLPNSFSDGPAFQPGSFCLGLLPVTYGPSYNAQGGRRLTPPAPDGTVGGAPAFASTSRPVVSHNRPP